MPTVALRRVRSRRAEACGRYPSSLIAAWTRSAVAGLTFCGAFKTLETVWRETPASLATSSTFGALVATCSLSCETGRNLFEITAGLDTVENPYLLLPQYSLNVQIGGDRQEPALTGAVSVFADRSRFAVVAGTICHRAGTIQRRSPHAGYQDSFINKI